MKPDWFDYFLGFCLAIVIFLIIHGDYSKISYFVLSELTTITHILYKGS